MSKLHSIWRRITSARSMRALNEDVARQRAEVARQAAEIDRLRAENRALLNSILGIAGIPPIQIGLLGPRLGEPGRSDTTFTPPSPQPVIPSPRRCPAAATNLFRGPPPRPLKRPRRAIPRPDSRRLGMTPPPRQLHRRANSPRRRRCPPFGAAVRGTRSTACSNSNQRGNP